MPTVTITDTERVIWHGPYHEFQRAWITRLCVAEFMTLDTEGSITIGGGELPEWRISLDRKRLTDMA